MPEFPCVFDDQVECKPQKWLSVQAARLSDRFAMAAPRPQKDSTDDIRRMSAETMKPLSDMFGAMGEYMSPTALASFCLSCDKSPRRKLMG